MTAPAMISQRKEREWRNADVVESIVPFCATTKRVSVGHPELALWDRLAIRDVPPVIRPPETLSSLIHVLPGRRITFATDYRCPENPFDLTMYSAVNIGPLVFAPLLLEISRVFV